MASARYATFDSRPTSSSSSSSRLSDPSPPPSKNSTKNRPDNASRALSRPRSAADVAAPKAKSGHAIGAMVKKLMEKKSTAKTPALYIPNDAIAADLKKAGGGGASGFSTLHRKLFQKGGGGSADRGSAKALAEVKANTRTLAMVLRSERELLGQNKEYEAEITELRMVVEERSREVEKLKDLCLKQREEIKALKDAILFPDVMNTQLHDLLEKQGSELKQAKQVIPSLQKQVSSLTGQIQCLMDDLAEVKADKYDARTCFDGHSNSPRTPIFDYEAANSLEYSSGDPITCGYGSPDDMFLKDLNPCLTPCFAKTRSSKEYDGMFSYDSPNRGRRSPDNNTRFSPDIPSFSRGGMISKSSERCQRPSSAGSTALKMYKSDERKRNAGKSTYQNLFGV